MSTIKTSQPHIVGTGTSKAGTDRVKEKGWEQGGSSTSTTAKSMGGTQRKVTSSIGGGTELPSMTSHFQEGPRIGNQYLEDNLLKDVLVRLTSEEVVAKADPELKRLGHRVANDVLDLHKALNDPFNHPYVRHYDAWGKRIDDIVTSEAWKEQKKVAAEEGVVATGYRGEFGDGSTPGKYNRVIQFAKLFLYSSSSGLYSCPLAMTDGAANMLRSVLFQDPSNPNTERYFGNFRKEAHPETLAAVERAYERLTTTDPEKFETSGQWMTERGGGSDVAAGTETIARLQPDGSYKLYGYKWFTSATDADMSVTLARIEDPDTGSVNQGSAGLSCFMVRVRNEDGSLNNMRVHRLKDKLGTQQLPTAEMELVGTRAMLLSLPGRGVGAITGGMVNTTRLYNSISAVAGMRRMIALNRDYAYRRTAFNRKLSDNPLHLRTLAQLELQYRACLNFTMDVVSLMSNLESNAVENKEEATKSEMLLRLLTPILKLYTAKEAIANASEGLEGFGGQGFIESTNIPVILRDAQVLPIWEGTTNVLSHDVLRVLTKTEGEAMRIFSERVRARCTAASSSTQFENCAASLLYAVSDIETFLKSTLSDLKNFHRLEARARDLSMSLARVYTGSVLMEHALWSSKPIDVAAARRFILNKNSPLVSTSLLPAVGANVEADDDDEAKLLALSGLDNFGDRDPAGQLRSKY